MSEPKGIEETKDLLRFTTVLGKLVAGNPAITEAFKKKDFKVIGGLFLLMASNPELQNAGVAAFTNIGEIPAEIKDIKFLEGTELAAHALSSVQEVYLAYASSQN